MTQDGLFFKFTAQLSDRMLPTNQMSVKEEARGREQIAGLSSALRGQFSVNYTHVQWLKPIANIDAVTDLNT